MFSSFVFQIGLSDKSISKKLTHEEKVELAKKEVASGGEKESTSKGEDGDKSKRSASHLISFFSQSKSSKNKEKENSKEKEKSKSKEKGKSTPPLDNKLSDAKSAVVGKLERQGSTSSINSQKSEGKSWRKSLGILGGGSKHDKEDKPKKNPNHRAATPTEVSTEARLKEENSFSGTEKKEEKLKKKRRSSTPTAELIKKNSQEASVAAGSDSQKTDTQNKGESLKEENRSSIKLIRAESKEEKSVKKRRSSTPTAELLKKNSQDVSIAKDSSVALNTVMQNREEKHINIHPLQKEEDTSLTHLRIERASANSTAPGSSSSDAAFKTGKTDSSNTTSVQLRDKKGRLTADNRRVKAKSLGDISNSFHKVEVSILDPTVPPSRTVDTMDIPDQMSAQEIKRPMPINAVYDLPPIASKHEPQEQKLDDCNKDVHGDNALNENNIEQDAFKNSPLGAYVSVSSSSAESEPVSISETSGRMAISTQDPALENNQDNVKDSSAPVKKMPSGSGSKFLSDISELSAELSAAIASPPPKPIVLNKSESSLLSTGLPSNRRAKDGGKKLSLFKFQISVHNFCVHGCLFILSLDT